jgi:REP element-mobilizing transposase RayT
LVNRCVRRAFLCGDDAFSGQNFEHRRAWVENRIRELASVFAIDVAAYAVMSNHYHVVVRVDADCAGRWSVDEVLRRWTQLFSGPLLVQRYLDASQRSQMGEAEIAKVGEFAELYRERLFDVSWYMRVLNESIARQANAEDGVKGRFWEGRFKSQALLDEQALLAVMAYVDLNPVRAGMSASLEDGAHTSIAARLSDLKQARAGATAQPPSGAHAAPQASSASEAWLEAVGQAAESPLAIAEWPAAVVSGAEPDTANGLDGGLPGNGSALLPEPALAGLRQAPLMPFDPTGDFARAVPFGLEEYLDLVDTMGRVVHPKKRGAIADHVPTILERLGMDAEAFVACVDTFFGTFAHAVGTPESLRKLACARQRRALRGMATARQMLCGHGAQGRAAALA